MGREFLNLFEQWAESYDRSVEGYDEQYRDVFAGYDRILSTVADKAGQVVLEFGVGTGNLTKKLLERGKQVYGIEPSAPMRKKAAEKLSGRAVILDGDFLQFPTPPEPIDTIASTYAFHHLTDAEKDEALAKYSQLLHPGGKIVFADTAFRDKEAFRRAIEEARTRGFHDLADDLEREYYTTLDVLESLFSKHGFSVSFAQQNAFVWVMEAVKQTT
ncbi:class I SAM-dependent methyltransferase [Geobacillus sp. TFV-3]|uniref:class I SAM-dependent methyltransferase n=1 Tax=Geobacillus sp. TFV-3 TaxID=1897059 RepID=UPI001359C046|nr:class I SAM-dependent methyltransferase [Geobacillus sp. TFV-3]